MINANLLRGPLSRIWLQEISEKHLLHLLNYLGQFVYTSAGKRTQQPEQYLLYRVLLFDSVKRHANTDYANPLCVHLLTWKNFPISHFYIDVRYTFLNF